MESQRKLEERSDCGSGGCITCPFSCNDKAEEIQNYGCLPDRQDIIKMKEESGHNWACHGDETVLCGGFARYVAEKRPDLDIKSGGLISCEVWTHKGPEVAMALARIPFDPFATMIQLIQWFEDEAKNIKANTDGRMHSTLAIEGRYKMALDALTTVTHTAAKIRSNYFMDAFKGEIRKGDLQ